MKCRNPPKSASKTGLGIQNHRIPYQVQVFETSKKRLAQVSVPLVVRPRNTIPNFVSERLHEPPGATENPASSALPPPRFDTEVQDNCFKAVFSGRRSSLSGLGDFSGPWGLLSPCKRLYGPLGANRTLPVDKRRQGCRSRYRDRTQAPWRRLGWW